jgi:hypothetical protein
MQIDLTALPEDSGVLQSMIRDIITTTMQRDTLASVTAMMRRSGSQCTS